MFPLQRAGHFESQNDPWKKNVGVFIFTCIHRVSHKVKGEMYINWFCLKIY